MKKQPYIILLISAFTCLSLHAQQKESNEVFYYYQGEKIFLTEKPDKVFIKLSKDANREKVSGIIAADEAIEKKSREAIEKTWSPFIILESKDEKSLSKETIKKYKDHPDIVSASTMLEYKDGTLQGIMDEIIIKLKKGTTLSQLKKLATNYQCLIVEENQFTKDQFLLSVSKTSGLNALQIANALYETGLFEFSVPNFYRHNILCSNDSLYDQQWALKNTGQNGGITGIDIKIERAWEITEGDPTIRIAVVDEGVELNHPDLEANLLTGYDATGNGTGGGPMFDQLEGVKERHGTSCAGIIAAIKDNEIGISGVAPKCKILPVHASFKRASTDLWLSDGIKWAYKEEYGNADVISNSWGGGSPSSAMENAIDSALLVGRGGKGCVLVFASGNYDTIPVLYPASRTDVIAVGAASPCGERKSPSSCDSLYWGGNYGSALDVVAPGVLIPTTDLTGTDGYANGNYTLDFGGTSAACPHVAGIAALILSREPNLTYSQVRQLIESTAQKTGGYNYQSTAGRPNGKWYYEMGYGLVNAHAAVRAVCPSTIIENQAITGNQFIACDNVIIRGAAVIEGAKLTIDAKETIIPYDFEFELGAELDIK